MSGEHGPFLDPVMAGSTSEQFINGVGNDEDVLQTMKSIVDQMDKNEFQTHKPVEHKSPIRTPNRKKYAWNHSPFTNKPILERGDFGHSPLMSRVGSHKAFSVFEREMHGKLTASGHKRQITEKQFD